MPPSTEPTPRAVVDVYRPDHPVSLRMTAAPLAMGPGDPSLRLTADGFWRAVRTPDGPATLHVAAGAGAHRGAFRIRAWGDGAEWARTSVPELLGARDDWSGLDLSALPRLATVRDRAPGLRLTRTGLVFAALAPAIIGQKTTGRQAHASWRQLVIRFGSPAPGPAPRGLIVPPDAATWQRIPSWDWHRAGVQPAQSRTLVVAARAAASVEPLAALDAGDPVIESRLRAVPGVGVWTAAETRQRSHGDPDAVSVGDYGLSKDVGWALIGKPVDDDGMLELLEPWRGHRQRIVRLIGVSGIRRPRMAPRITIQDHRRF